MILALLQARMSSSRLPGKVLKLILGQSMLIFQIERIKRSKKIDNLIVATSSDSSDDEIHNLCKQNGVECYRGSLEDVLDRFYQAANVYKPDHVVRFTGDCPLIDPVVIDNVIELHLKNHNDYTSVGFERTLPDGLDVEIFTFQVLEKAWQEADLPSQREHVTPYIYNHPEKFKLGYYKNEKDLSHLRWTVDEEIDYILVKGIYEALYPDKPDFTTQDVLNYLERNPELKTINIKYEYNEGYKKSLRKDKEILNRKKSNGG